MLVIAVSCHNEVTVLFVDLTVMSLGLGVALTPFPATSTFLQCAAGSMRVSLMTGLIPRKHAACAQAPRSVETHTAK